MEGGSAILFGRTEPLAKIQINQTEYTPKVTFEKKGQDTAVYTLEVPEIDVTLTAMLHAADNSLSFTIPEIKGSGEPKVMSIAIPEHRLISVNSSQPGAQVVTTRVGIGQDQKESFQTLVEKPVDPKPEGWTYAIVHTERLAATIHANTLPERNRLLAANDR